MALQFVRACEPLPAEEPVADEGPIPTVPSQVGLQVGGLGIGFATARDVTVVHVLPPAVVGALAHLLGVDAIRAAAHSLASTSGRGAALGFGASRHRGLLRFLQGERFLLQHLRGQWLHLEAVLGEEVGRVRGRSVLSRRQRAQLWVRAIRP